MASSPLDREKERRFDILGIGMSMMDSIQVIEEFPHSGGVTEVRRSALMGGGPVPTALCAAARLGADVGIIDRIGSDWRGDLIREDYGKFGVDTRFLQSESGKTSTFGTALVRERDGERHIVFQRGTFSELEREEIPVSALQNCSFLHLNGRHLEAAKNAAKIVSESGGLVSFDGGANRFDPRFCELFPDVDILIVARDFAARLAESDDRETQLASLRKWGSSLIGITDGARGSWFVSKEDGAFHQPAFPADSVVDTTGCGDTFHGAFLAARSRGNSWKRCAEVAAAAAAINASSLGGRGDLPNWESVEKRMK